MVHQYKNNGYNIVLDVNSGAIHVVDDVTYDVIELFEDNSAKEIIEKLVDRYPQTEIEEAIQEVNELKDNEELFTEDTYKERIIDFKKRQTVVKALCLHIAHDCNLACRYCFAEEGEYHGRRALMSYETGKQHLSKNPHTSPTTILTAMASANFIHSAMSTKHCTIESMIRHKSAVRCMIHIVITGPLIFLHIKTPSTHHIYVQRAVIIHV